jgi:hypothetical protein
MLVAVIGFWCGTAAAAAYTASFTQLSTSNTPSAPEWRGWSAMTWIGSLDWVVLWGGSGGNFLNDVQALDPTTAEWTTLSPNASCPGNTSFLRPNGSDESGVVWDSISDLLWIYNGGSGYRCGTPQNVGRTAGAGTTSTSIVDATLSGTINYKDWTVRAPNGANAFVTAYSPATKTLTLGAALSIGPGSSYDLFADFGGGTWWYDFASGQYAKLQQVHWGYSGYVPAPRKSPGFAGDGKKAFLFGGLDYDNGTYKLDFATRTYSTAIAQGSFASPPARGEIQNQFVYDGSHNRYVLFGGRCYDPARCVYQGMLDDTWLYDPVGNAWTLVNVAIRPPARHKGQMYFDQAHGVVVLYGGANGATGLNDLWTFDVATLAWTRQALPAVNPGGIFLGQVAYAPTTNCGYLVYGFTASSLANGGTWRLCLTSGGGGGGAAPSSTTLAATPNPSTSGGTATFLATVTGNAPTGTVIFKSDGAVIATCSAVSLTGSDNVRTASCTTSALAVGTHTIIASYVGDAGNSASTSSTLTQVVNALFASVNVALTANGGVASASSTNGPGFPASAVNDNRRSGANWGAGGGWNDATSGVFPDWVQINFNGVKTIDRAVVYSVQDNYLAPVEPTDTTTFSLRGITDFQVQGYNGSSWVTLATVAGNNLVKRTVTFAPFPTDRIRINVTHALASWTRITEVEAWGQ